MANGHGGKRPGSGRPKGTRGVYGMQRRTQMAIRRWAIKQDPNGEITYPAIDVMRDNLMYWHRRARDEAVQVMALLEERDATPDQLLKFVALYHRSRDKSQEVARDLIKYEESLPTPLRTLDLREVPDDVLNDALISMGSDLDELYARAMAKMEAEGISEAEFEDVPAAK
jgi:hypothetical protein